MAIQIKHPFVSLKGDGGDATLIRPSNWNALHTTSMATQNLIGRLTAGAGAFEEIPLTSFMAAFLAAADYATLAGMLGLFETGDVKPTFRTTASVGWVKLAGGNLQANTIGNAASGAVLRNNADTLALFTIIWDGCTNTEAPIYDSAGSASTRGANAAADFAANKRLAIPNGVGKAIVGAGAANSAGLITVQRLLGTQFGADTLSLAANQIPSLTSSGNNSITVSSGNAGGGGNVMRSQPTNAVFIGGTPSDNAAYSVSSPPTFNSLVSTNPTQAISVNYTNGAQQAVPLQQASLALNLMVKL